MKMHDDDVFDNDDRAEASKNKKEDARSIDEGSAGSSVVFLGEQEVVDSSRYGARTHVQIRLKNKFTPAVIDLADSETEEWFNANSEEYLSSVERGLERVESIAKLLENNHPMGLTLSKKEAEGVTSYDKIRIEYVVHMNATPPYYVLETSRTNVAHRIEYSGFDLFLSLSPTLIAGQGQERNVRPDEEKAAFSTTSITASSKRKRKMKT